MTKRWKRIGELLRILRAKGNDAELAELIALIWLEAEKKVE